jgi:hypothetical protein
MKSIIKTLFVWSLMISPTLALLMIADPALAKPLRFIYLQGYLSCSHSNQQPVAAFLDAAARHPDAAMYYGCFDGGYETHPLDPIEHFYLYKVTADGQWSEATAMAAQTAPLEITTMLRQETSTAADDAPDQDVDVLIAGHSHGGWMAIRLAYQLGLTPEFHLQELLTIDPISYDLCASQWFPSYVLLNSVRWFGEPHDCHRAPRDIEHLTPAVAAAAGDGWTNIYQTSMPFVSSGPISAANRNLLYTSPSVLDTLTAHRAAFIDPASWQMFYRRLRALTAAER